MNTEGHGVKARRDDSVPFCIYHLAFSRFKVRLQRSSQYDFFPSFFSLNLTSSETLQKSSDAFWCICFSSSFTGDALGVGIIQALLYYVLVVSAC